MAGKGLGEQARQPQRLSASQQQRQQIPEPVQQQPIQEPEPVVAEPVDVIEEPVAEVTEPVAETVTEQPQAVPVQTTQETETEAQLRAAVARPYTDLELAQLGIDDAEYKASLANVQAKVELLDNARAVEQSYQEAGQEITPETQQQLSTMKALALSPFIDLTKGTIDVQTAIKAGATDEQLTALGVPITDVVTARRDLRTEKEARQVGVEVQKIEGEREAERKQEWERAIQGQVSNQADSETRFLQQLSTAPHYLQEAYASGGVDSYNKAVDEYNETLRIARAVYPPTGVTSMISPEMRKLAESSDFIEKYKTIVQPGDVTTEEYSRIAPFVTPYSVDVLGAQKAGVPNSLISKVTGVPITSDTLARMTSDMVSTLSPDDRKTYDTLQVGDKFAFLQAKGIVPANARLSGTDSAGNPIYLDTNGLEQAMVAGNVPTMARISATEAKKWAPVVGRAAGQAAIAMTPVVGTIAYWKDMSPTWRALSIVLDVASLVPFVGAAAEGARAARGITRTDRLVAAVMGVTDKASGELVARGMRQELIAQVRAPVDVVLHPVQATKATARGIWELGENVFSPRKVPFAVLTTNYGTVRLPISATTSPAEAMAIRDKLMLLAARGERPLVEINGVKYSLERSAFMTEMGGGLASGTPMGEVFAQEATINKGGLFLSHEPLPRFAQSTATGVTGERPAFVIVSPQLAKDAIPSFKTYGSVVEMELVLPPGYVVPAPKQVLYTRINGVKTEIFLDKPLTASQRIRLKQIAFVEDLKAPFKPALTVSGDTTQTFRFRGKDVPSNINVDNKLAVDQITDVLRRSGNTRVVASFRNAARLALSRSQPQAVASGYVTYSSPTTGEQVRDRVTLTAVGEPDIPIRRTTGVSRRDSIIMQYRPGLMRVDRRDIQRADEIRASGERTAEPRSTEIRSATDRVTSRRSAARRSAEVRSLEPRTVESRTIETRMQGVRAPEVRTPGIRVTETRVPELRTPELRTPVVRTPDIRQPEIREPEIREPEIREPAIKEPELRVPTGRVVRLSTNSPMSQPIPAGSIAWAYGERKGARGALVQQWYYIPPEDFGTAAKPRSLSAPPTGARVTNSVKPRETIQIVGRSRLGVPKLVTVDLGWTDVTITNGNQISFAGGGLKTDVGTRVASNTVGMSVDENRSTYLDDVESYEPAVQGINRPKMSKAKPKRTGRRSTNDIDSITSLRGLKI